MTVSYLGPDSLALQKWIELIASGTYLQAFLGAADSAGAKARLYEVETEDEEAADRSTKRPCGYVDITGMHAVGPSGVCVGAAVLRLEKTRDPGTTVAEAFRDMANHAGLIKAEIQANARADVTGTMLNTVRDEDPLDGPYRPMKQLRDSKGDFLWVTMRMPYGPRG